ncbi:MAG TPA: hypothetical protein VFY45_12970 [Baekduia sp.]|nr:hypothetical protein [Baekduia sp.]
MPRESQPVDDRRAKHLTAIGRSLAQARVGDFTDALGSLGVVEAVGHDLSDEHRARREF